MIDQRQALDLYRRGVIRSWPGDCAYCRARQRGGNEVHYKDGKIYCLHHGMDNELNAEQMVIPRGKP